VVLPPYYHFSQAQEPSHAEPPPIHVPKYRVHKPTGLAVVRLSGRDVYLGRHGTPESAARYQAAVAAWLKSDRQPPPRPKRTRPRHDLVLNELILAYLKFAEGYYVKHGAATGEVTNVKDALRHASSLRGDTPISEFGPSDLKAVRAAMVDAGLCRSVVNGRTNRIRRMFKWGVENELVSPTILQGLQAVAPLKRGRSDARETMPVRPMLQTHINEVLERVTRPIRAMIELQLVTGMRPGEVVWMRTRDIDVSGMIREYRPESHKTEHHGIERTVFLGPRAQEIIRPLLRAELGACLFCPRDALRDMREQRAAGVRARRPANQRDLSTTHTAASGGSLPQ
jgi:integrase